MRKYLAMYKEKKIEVFAETSYQAQTIAAGIFKARKPHTVWIIASEKEHNPSILPGS